MLQILAIKILLDHPYRISISTIQNIYIEDTDSINIEHLYRRYRCSISSVLLLKIPHLRMPKSQIQIIYIANIDFLYRRYRTSISIISKSTIQIIYIVDLEDLYRRYRLSISSIQIQSHYGFSVRISTIQNILYRRYRCSISSIQMIYIDDIDIVQGFHIMDFL